MTATSKTIVFFGNERLVSGLKSTDTPILRGLIDQGYNVAAIVSHHNESSSRNRRPLEVADVAREYNIPILLPNKPSEIIDQLREYNAEAAILVAYGRIIPQTVIDIFPKGIVNIHPSLLPKYRGPTPIESSILNGDQQTGVSIMQLTAGMDEGPIYDQVRVKLEGNETKFDLYNILSQKSATLLFDVLPAILDGNLIPTPQDSSGATYSRLFKKEDSFLDLTALSAVEAERTVRAFLGFPKSKLSVNGHIIIVTKSHTSLTKEAPLSFICSDGAYLCVDELIAPSGRRMTDEAFEAGYAA